MGEPFDVILSDMAPKTTGVRSADADRSYALNQHALWLAEQHLSPGGCLLVKAFREHPSSNLAGVPTNVYRSQNL